MRVFTTPTVQKQIKKFPLEIRKKIIKTIKILRINQNHPSLRFRKKANSDQYEGRISIHYRFSGEYIGEDFYITSVGIHDEGLGKR